MINGKRILAIIPARGGSKGIPGKNIIQVAGKPLIQYTIEAANASKYIDEIHVSTDDSKIASIVENLEIHINRLRPSKLAQDNSKTIDVVIDVLNYYQSLNNYYDFMILLQPTQPLRQSFHIDEAIEKFYESNEDSLVSVCLVEEHPILMRQISENGKLQPLLQQSSTVRRQEFQPFYLVNGAIYINKVESINVNTSLNDNLIPYIMDRKYHVDIDVVEDLINFEEKLKRLAINEESRH